MEDRQCKIHVTNLKKNFGKLEVLKDVFTPISLDGLEIPEEKIEKAKADMKDFKAFKDEMLDLRLTLCYRDALEGV